GDERLAHERERGVVDAEMSADDERGDAVRCRPARARRRLDRDGEPARVRDRGEHATQTVARGDAGRSPARGAALEHQTVVRGVRPAVLDVAVERPAERLDWISQSRATGERGIERREAVVADAIDERLLVAEVMIHGRRRDPGARTELADGEIAVGGKQCLGSTEDRRTRRLRVAIADAGHGGHARRVAPLYCRVKTGAPARRRVDVAGAGRGRDRSMDRRRAILVTLALALLPGAATAALDCAGGSLANLRVAPGRLAFRASVTQRGVTPAGFVAGGLHVRIIAATDGTVLHDVTIPGAEFVARAGGVRYSRKGMFAGGVVVKPSRRQQDTIRISFHESAASPIAAG